MFKKLSIFSIFCFTITTNLTLAMEQNGKPTPPKRPWQVDRWQIRYEEGFHHLGRDGEEIRSTIDDYSRKYGLHLQALKAWENAQKLKKPTLD